ncbi:MAG: chitinase [Acidimicrobiales bacterium]
MYVMLNPKIRAVALIAVAVAAVSVLAGASAASARSKTWQPVAMAAPYEYLGWGNPQPPAKVIEKTGVPDLTLAFILAHDGCDPEWDGQRPVLGGSDATAIQAIRSAGGDVDVSFGGWSGHKLGIECTTVSSLVGAYQTVIDDYGLSAIDIDIEHTEFTQSPVRERVIEALAQLQTDDPMLAISVTFGTNESGPDADGEAMITQAAQLGFQPYAWTIMPFDFGTPVKNMAVVSIEAAEGLEADLATAYGESASMAYAHVGISSMNGETDDTGETVSVANFEKILAFAESEHLARLTFWAVNRDRQCTGSLSTAAGSCSGIEQPSYAFTDLVSQFRG